MPSKVDYTANGLYSDVVYGWLQVNSCWSEGETVRWIPKKDVKFVDIGNALGISRQTASTKFKRLLDKDEKGNVGLGLVHYNESKKRYELIELEEGIAMLIQNGTLSKMISALSEHSISVFTYLFKRYWANNCQPFEFTIDQIKRAIGISVATKSNNYIVDNILSVLAKLELLEYTTVTKMEQGEVKTVLQMTLMRNEIPEPVKAQKIGREIKC